ncbi:MAG: hypothetical protein IMHGJWDQ_001301 [Candidatus Fervidibacter sp.]
MSEAVRRRLPVWVVWFLLALTFLGILGGLLMVFSASYPLALARKGNAFYFVFRQALYALLGIGLFLLAWRMPLSFLRHPLVSGALHLLAVMALGLTLLYGERVGAAQRWLEIGRFQVQPSEFAKVSLILCLAAFAARWWAGKSLRAKLGWTLALWGCWMLTVAFVLFQPHLSGGLLFALIGLSTLFFARMPLVVLVLFVMLSGGLGYLSREGWMHSYQRERWQVGATAFSLGSRTDEARAYQVRQALLGLKMGGWFGQGLFQSRQKHLFLPSAHNDFIFAVIGEEVGIVGTVLVLAFFGVLAFTGLKVTSQTSDAFASGVAGGVTGWLWLQAMLHIAANVHLIPPTGVPLPFVSAGGSALCATLTGMGLLLNVASTLLQEPQRQGGKRDAMGDGRGRDRRTHLPRPRTRHRRQNLLA